MTFKDDLQDAQHMVTYISFVLRSLRGPLLPLLAFHIILLFIALVTFVAVCGEAVSSRRSHEDIFSAVNQFKTVISLVL